MTARAQEWRVPAAASVTGAFATLVAGLAAHPVLALAVPIAMIGGAVMLLFPFLGLGLLTFFAYPDALADKIFFMLPVSSFKLFTGLTVLAVAIAAWRGEPGLTRSLRSPLVGLAILFSIALFVSSIFSDSKAAALGSLRQLFSMIVLMILFLILVDRLERLRIVLGLLLGAAILSGIILIIDTVLGVTLVATSDAATTARSAEGFDRSSGASNENPTTAATMMLFGVVLAVFLFLEQRRYRPLLALVAGVGVLAILLSFARSSMIVLALVLAVMALRYTRTRLFPLGLAMAFVMGLAAIPFLPPELWERIGSIFGGGGDWTLGRRLAYNVIGFDLLVENPLLGVGPGNFKIHFTDEEYRFLPGRTLSGRQLHNMYLSVLVEYGMIGGGLFITMLAMGVQRVRAVIRTPASDEMQFLATGFLYGYVAFLLVSVFVPNEYNKFTWLLTGIAWAFPIVNAKQDAAR